MAGKFLIASALMFFSSLAFAETKVETETPEFYKVGGSCPKTESVIELNCSDSPEKVTLYKFNLSPSKSIKTTSKACPAAMIEEALKLPEGQVVRLLELPSEPDEFEYKVESCTLFAKSSSEPQLAMIIRVQTNPIDPEARHDKDTVYRKFTFVKVDSKDKPQKSLKTIHARETHTDRIQNLRVDKICDTNGDDQADIVLKENRYFSEDYQVIKIQPETDEVNLGAWKARQSCGC